MGDAAENRSVITSKVYIGFIDVLFGVIVGVSFTDFRAILVPIIVKFETFTLLLAYVTVIGSWIGYHIAIENKPDRSVYRFMVDLIILYLYFYLIYSVQNFSVVVMLLPVIFGFYIIWDFTRVMEDYNNDLKEYEKVHLHSSLTNGRPQITRYIYHSIWGSRWNKVNTIFFFLFIIQLMVYHFLAKIALLQQRVFLDATLSEWYIWITSLTMLILYRWIKEVYDMLRRVTSVS